MLGKVDLQLFRASIRVISAELNSIPNSTNIIPKRVFEELSCMEMVIERDHLESSRDFKWLDISPALKKSKN
jgi:hypothetical protein